MMYSVHQIRGQCLLVPLFSSHMVSKFLVQTTKANASIPVSKVQRIQNNIIKALYLKNG